MPGFQFMLLLGDHTLAEKSDHLFSAFIDWVFHRIGRKGFPMFPEKRGLLVSSEKRVLSGVFREEGSYSASPLRKPRGPHIPGGSFEVTVAAFFPSTSFNSFFCISSNLDPPDDEAVGE
ncbi:hypothetical protein B0H14DRAFT_3169176, partial [Mycena olivaceomarginata]